MTKQELNAALKLHSKIHRLQCQLDDLHITGGVGAVGNGTPVQGAQGADYGQMAAELSQEIDHLKRLLEVEQIIIRRYIDKLPFDEVERKLMILRYVQCRHWKYVAISIGYGKSRMFDIHVGAMAKFGVRRSSSDL